MALAVSMIIGLCYARYGTAGVRRLAHLRLHHPLLVGLAVLFQVALVAGLRPTLLLTLGSAVCFLGFAWANKHNFGVLLTVAGALLNFLVMAAAGGRMPVRPAVVAHLGEVGAQTGMLLAGTKSVVGMPHWSSLTILSDWILLPGAMGIAAWSIGDMLLLAGLALVFWKGMKGDEHAQAY